MTGTPNWPGRLPWQPIGMVKPPFFGEALMCSGAVETGFHSEAELQPEGAGRGYWDMRQSRPVAMVLTLAALALAPLATGDVAAQGARLSEAALAGSGAPTVLALPSGVVWDYDGYQVLRSTDAGATWKAVLPTWPVTQLSLQVTGAFFLNAEDAWAETQHEWPAQPGVTTTWETTDGGATWHQGMSLPGTLLNGPPGFDEFAFADVEQGFGFGVGARSAPTVANPVVAERQDYLWATTDGGRHWAQQPAVGLPWEGSTYSDISAKGCGSSNPFNLTVVTASELFVWDAGCPTIKPGLWESRDGGHESYPVHLRAPRGGWAASETWQYPRTGQAGVEVTALRSFSNGDGVLAVTTRPGELLVYRAADVGSGVWSLASVLQTGSLARPAGFWASSPSEWEMPAPAGLYVTTDAGRHWELERSGLSLPEWTEVSFASPASGVAFGNFPELGMPSSGTAGMRTSDGGLSWKPFQFQAPSFLAGTTTEVPFGTVDFVNFEDGWVGGADGVEATTDGGSAWAPQLATPEPVEELSFADAEHGWSLTTDELLSTSDGGHTWSVEPETALGAFSYVQLVGPSFGVGVICGQPGGTRVLATDDEGRTWQLLPVPDPDRLECGSVPPSPGVIAGICFGTARVGWAILRVAPAGPAVVELSSDAGLEWSLSAKLSSFPGALACQGTSDAWLGFTDGEHGGESAVAGTTDGGRTWRINVHASPHSPVATPGLTASDGTVVGTLATSQEPAGVLDVPVRALAAPGPGDVVDLWEDYSAACISGFGLALTTDGGTNWTAAPDTGSLPPCGTTSLPFLSPAPYLPPSFSFPDAQDGFVLAPAVGTPAIPKGTTEQVTMALIGTADAGQSWHLLARFRPHPVFVSNKPERRPAAPCGAVAPTPWPEFCRAMAAAMAC